MEHPQQHQWTRKELLSALHHNQFVPFFQPKVDLATGIPTCVEILARWEHPEFGILPPSQFIELIEIAGLIDQFTDDLLRQSLACAQKNAVNGKEVGLAINYSPLALQNPHTPRRICSLVEEYGMDFDRITIEVTERATPESVASVLNSLTHLRSQGFKISIDDFGPGYSSLKLLSQMPFTEMKIDRMFIAGIPNSKKLTDILESIVQLADKLDLSTVAEGIETKAQLDFMRALGCSFAQGFYLGAPMRNLELNDYL